MSEGHSIIRWARALRPLCGEPLVRVELPDRYRDRELVGRLVERIDTHGKHLLIVLSGGLILHCHALMFGSWQFGPPGMKLRKPSKSVRLRLQTADREAVFFNGPVVEVLTREERDHHPRLTALGPDLLDSDFDGDEVWRRLARRDVRPLTIAEAILDQTVIAGIGNIYKSEGLFLAGIDPRRPTGSLKRESLEQLWSILIPLMKAGSRQSGSVITRAVTPGERRQRANRADRHWVYQRHGRNCYLCQTRVQRIRQGKNKRATFFCPLCQKPAASNRPAIPSLFTA